MAIKQIPFIGVQLFSSPVLPASLPPAARGLHEYTEDDLHRLIGRKPTTEEVESSNCTEQGTAGHLQCGCCVVHQVPRKVCGCLAPHGEITDPIPAYRITMRNYSCAVEIERIFGWPGLETFESISSRLMYYVGESMTERVQASMGADVECFLRGLVDRGVLYRGNLWAWYYKPCGEK